MSYKHIAVAVCVALLVVMDVRLASFGDLLQTSIQEKESSDAATIGTAPAPPLAVEESLLEAFREAKQRSMIGSIPDDSCLLNFSRLQGYDEYADMTALEQRRVAETFFQRQQGRLWMQHSRKAGGTTLCMILRLNQHGLIQTSSQHWTMPARETCQMVQFCRDCDLTAPEHKFQGWETIPRLVDCQMNKHGRNFFEAEGTVSPPTIRTDPEWANYAFVSTIRHPIARIISSLRNDIQYRGRSCTLPANPKQLGSCAKQFLSSSEQKITSLCRNGIYLCYSNYYVRMFAGLPNEQSILDGAGGGAGVLQAAKDNFRRYSCVVLTEQFEKTYTCLSTKLGLHLSSQEQAFNVQGALRAVTNSSATRNSSNTNSSHVGQSYHDFAESLTSEEYNRLVNVNTLDLEFFTWAKELILSGYFST